jgi:rhodanese-related sulfurtransferase
MGKADGISKRSEEVVVTGDRESGKEGARGIRRVSASEAKSLLDLGYAYVDVRTAAEFDEIHPEGALNIPFVAPSSRAESGEFLTVMRRRFAEDAKIVVGCATGVRSLRAAELLVRAGFSDVVDQRAGMDGARGPFGNLAEPGWAAAGLPVASGRDGGSFAALEPQGSADAERARS